MSSETFLVTWETITEASAEAGDVSARGYMRAGIFAPYPGDGAPLADAPDHLSLQQALEALHLPGEPWAALESIETDSSGPDCEARNVSAFLRLDGPVSELEAGEGDDSRVLGARVTIHFPAAMTQHSRARVCRCARQFRF